MTRPLGYTVAVGGGGGSTPDADATTKGKVQLAGDLAGTAAAPVVANSAITSAKIADGTIVDADISGTAAIAVSKVSGALVAANNLSDVVAATARTNLAVPPSARSVATTAPLSGGGDLSADRTLTVAAATGSAVGVVQLAGDLGGTATAPTVPGKVPVYATASHTTNFTATVATLHLVDTTGGAVTATLPAAGTAGQQVAIKLNAGTTAVTVVPSGADTIGAAATTASITLAAEVWEFVSSGAGQWNLVAGNKSLASTDGRYAQRANNLLDVASVATSRANLGLGTVALLNSVTDTTTVPTYEAVIGTAGANALASPRDHAHPRTAWTAADHGHLTWTTDIVTCGNSGGSSPTAGTLFLMRVHLPVAAPVTNIVMFVQTAGVTLTSGQNFTVLYTAAGTRVAATADQTTAWGTSGFKTMALAGGPYAQAAGDYYIGLWWNGTTVPAFARTSSLNNLFYNAGLAAPNLRACTADTGLTTTAPATLGAQSAIDRIFWAALS